MTYPQGPIPTTRNPPILTPFFVSPTLYALYTLKFICNTQTQQHRQTPITHILPPSPKGQHSCLTFHYIHPPSCLITPRHWLMPPLNHPQLSWKTTALPDNQWNHHIYPSNLTYEYVLNWPSTVKDIWAMGEIVHQLVLLLFDCLTHQYCIIDTSDSTKCIT